MGVLIVSRSDWVDRYARTRGWTMNMIAQFDSRTTSHHLKVGCQLGLSIFYGILFLDSPGVFEKYIERTNPRNDNVTDASSESQVPKSLGLYRRR